MEEKQIKYTDCHPVGKPGVRFPLADTDFDPYDTDARRAHMVAFMTHMGVYDEESWAKARAMAINALSEGLQEAEYDKVGIPYFELIVDQGIWIYFFKGEDPSPVWPWDIAHFDPEDLTQGVSTVYAAWLKDQAKKEGPETPDATIIAEFSDHAVAAAPVPQAPIASTSTPEPETESAPTIAKHSEQVVVATSVPEAQSASASASLSGPAAEPTPATRTTERVLPPPQGPISSQWTEEMDLDGPPALPLTAPQNRGHMLAPKVPSRSKRLDTWRALNRSDHWVAPICGPFEVLLPEWMDFGALVWGPEGAHFAYMHKELIDEDLIVTWGNKDGFPSKLIVGFRDDDNFKVPLCKMDRLGFLFTRVTNWVADVYDGNTQSLLNHLSLSRNMANESMYQPLKPGGRLCLAWEESRRRQ